MSTKTTRSTKKSTKPTKSKAATATAEDTKTTPTTEEIASPQSESIQICPSCGAPMVLRSGKYGSFFGCSRFKSGECRATVPIEQ